MSVLLKRVLALETVAYEPFTGVDGQGAPSYGSSVNTQANVEERSMGGRGEGARYVIGPDGSEVHVPLTLYIPGDEANVPSEQDRVTVSGSTYIVMERTPIRGLRAARSAPDHYRLRCSDE